jgi:hypothetical protein
MAIVNITISGVSGAMGHHTGGEIMQIVDESLYQARTQAAIGLPTENSYPFTP